MKITLTEKAAQHIQKMMAKKPAAIGFRVSVKTTGCNSYMYVPAIIDHVNPEDIKVVTENINLYIDKTAASILEGTQIDYKTMGLGQAQLVFNNPNVESECGCGESFSLKKGEK